MSPHPPPPQPAQRGLPESRCPLVPHSAPAQPEIPCLHLYSYQPMKHASNEHQAKLYLVDGTADISPSPGAPQLPAMHAQMLTSRLHGRGRPLRAVGTPFPAPGPDYCQVSGDTDWSLEDWLHLLHTSPSQASTCGLRQRSVKLGCV